MPTTSTHVADPDGITVPPTPVTDLLTGWAVRYEALLRRNDRSREAWDDLCQDAVHLPDGIDTRLPGVVPSERLATPLNRIVDHHRGDVVVEHLLRHGANPNTPDAHGATPLLTWCRSFSAPSRTRDLLIAAGADPSMADDQGYTPLSVTIDTMILDGADHDPVPFATMLALLDAGARWDVPRDRNHPDTLWATVMSARPQDEDWERVRTAFRQAEVRRLNDACASTDLPLRTARRL